MGFPDAGPALDGNLGTVFALFQRPVINISRGNIAARPLLSQASQPISAGGPATKIFKRARGFFATTTQISIPYLKGVWNSTTALGVNGSRIHKLSLHGIL
jgi:hypothetical protein